MKRFDKKIKIGFVLLAEELQLWNGSYEEKDVFDGGEPCQWLRSLSVGTCWAKY